MSVTAGVASALVAGQLLALAVVIVRLAGGRRRRPPVRSSGEGLADTTVSVLLPTLNEGSRVGPCLEGLHRHGAPLLEVLVVDSGSTDSTRAQVHAMAARDSRFRLIDDRPLPPGWIGKVWALECGRAAARGEWLLGVDADIEPRPGMVAAVVRAARADGFDIVSFSPRFAGMTAAEQWVQASLVATLVYRFGAAGSANVPPERVMANGQCFLARADALAGDGYAPARASFSDDVTLARYYAARGQRVGFLDGSALYVVRSYDSLRHMWREWGRSIDLSDSSTRGRQAGDIALLAVAQAAPIPVLATILVTWPIAFPAALCASLLAANGALLLVRVLLLFALAGSYERPGPGFWLSPLADPLAVLRIALSTIRRPKQWRGREYATLSAAR